MRVRKMGTGSSSHGYEWTEPGQILDIPAEHAAELVAIAPHEFEALPELPELPVEPEDEGDQDDDGEDQGDGAGEQPELVTEPAPGPEPEEAKPARGRRRVTEA
ncbi:hypothetical protein ABH931_004146 [Streptacidiphilus sp. MAP12-33]|uniref:hypothetical protein n=1 Tax=Streptacidiphilus sp. MAP12-33 TaxID=3156266 RepID=UPI003515F2C3